MTWKKREKKRHTLKVRSPVLLDLVRRLCPVRVSHACYRALSIDWEGVTRRADQRRGGELGRRRHPGQTLRQRKRLVARANSLSENRNEFSFKIQLKLKNQAAKTKLAFSLRLRLPAPLSLRLFFFLAACIRHGIPGSISRFQWSPVTAKSHHRHPFCRLILLGDHPGVSPDWPPRRGRAADPGLCRAHAPSRRAAFDASGL